MMRPPRERGPLYRAKKFDRNYLNLVLNLVLYRSLGLAAHLGWARLLVDRYRDLVEVPAPTREGPVGGRHHFAPDDVRVRELPQP